jgi:hypothetical protein
MERQSYQNRTAIKTGEGARWITVPVVQASRGERIADKRIDNSREGRYRWSRKALLTLKYAYQSAPHFGAHEAAIGELLGARWERLEQLNHRLIDFCRGALDIRTPMLRSSELKIGGAKSDMVLNMCRAVGADVYLAGAGASKSYLDVAAFERAGIRIVWQDFEHPRYTQHPDSGVFIEKLSALDLIFNCGPRSAEYFAEAAGARRALFAGPPPAANWQGVSA